MTQTNESWGMGAWTVFAQSGAPAAPQAGAAPAPAPQTTTTAPASGTTAAPASPGAAPAGGAGAGGFNPTFLLLMAVMFGVLLIGPILAGRKEKKKRAEMMSTLKRSDKVQMLGGIIGTVSEIGDDDVVVKVEEGRIRFHKSAIQAILSSRGKGDTSITEVKGEAKGATV